MAELFIDLFILQIDPFILQFTFPQLILYIVHFLLIQFYIIPSVLVFIHLLFQLNILFI